jgi:hypothetical protein
MTIRVALISTMYLCTLLCSKCSVYEQVHRCNMLGFLRNYDDLFVVLSLHTALVNLVVGQNGYEWVNILMPKKFKHAYVIICICIYTYIFIHPAG